MNSRKKMLWIAALLLLFAASKISLLLMWQKQKNIEVPPSTQATCNVATTGCPFLNTATLRLIGVRTNKTPFAIEARDVPDHVQKLTASFTMHNMEMGFNRFELTKQLDGTWRVDGVYLPFCVAGRHDWQIQWHADQAAFTANFQTQAQ